MVYSFAFTPVSFHSRYSGTIRIRARIMGAGNAIRMFAMEIDRVLRSKFTKSVPVNNILKLSNPTFGLFTRQPMMLLPA